MTPTQGRIPDSFIEALLAKTDIVALVQESVKLKKAGANYSACCPFHQEKTPSFTVSATKQFYHCFGCGQHGDAIGFVKETQGLNFVEAVQYLATRVGLQVPMDQADAAKSKEKQSTVSVLNRVQAFYAHQLKNHPQAAEAVAYLKKRGLTGTVAKTFGLGFAPESWHELYQHFQNDAEAITVLEQTGLIIKHPKGHYYDRFRHRIMFPIRSRKGEVIGFGARIISKGEPKYLNSPDSPIFHKGYCLYGIYEALQSKTKFDAAIVVEGYMDVVALYQHGVVGAMATLGTAITSHHLTALFQLNPEVVFCFDGDDAGRAAAWKALQLSLEQLTEDRQIRFVFLPQGDDPDTYIRQHGTKAFATLAKNGMPLSEYFFSQLMATTTPDSVDNRARLASIAKPLIEKIPQGIFKEMMFEQLAKIVASTPQVVRGEKAWRRFSASSNTKFQPIRPKLAPPPQLQEAAWLASAILISHPSLLAEIQHRLPIAVEMNTPGMELFQNVVNSILIEPQQTSETLRAQTALSALMSKHLTASEARINLLPIEALKEELLGATARLEGIGREQYCNTLLEKAKVQELSFEEKTQLKEFFQSRESIDKF